MSGPIGDWTVPQARAYLGRLREINARFVSVTDRRSSLLRPNNEAFQIGCIAAAAVGVSHACDMPWDGLQINPGWKPRP